MEYNKYQILYLYQAVFSHLILEVSLALWKYTFKFISFDVK